MNIEVRGLDALMKKLDTVTAEKTLVKGLMNAGKSVQKQAKLLCPVDEGRLRASIEVNQKNNKSVSIGTNVEYAQYVEYGTGLKGDSSVPHTTKEKWVYKKGDRFYTTSGNAPQPFLHLALAQRRQNVVNIIRYQFKKALGGK